MASLESGSGAAVIQLLEAQLDGQLGRPRVSVSQLPSAYRAAVRWSEALWARGEALGPVVLDTTLIERGVHLAEYPLFIVGAHRSGTTLMRDLLDGHPALTVLPAEGNYLTQLEAQVRPLGEAARGAFGREWLRRLANPINQAPYWLLGRSSPEANAYLFFVRSLLSWWRVFESHRERFPRSWMLLALVTAYAHAAGHLRHELRLWVEKTPTNERFLAMLSAEFPKARFVHMVRDPLAAYSSHKHAGVKWTFRYARRVLIDLERSLRLAAEAPPIQYRVVRFEDLLADPEGQMEQVASFLGITPHEVLRTPSIAGLPSISNSSFREDAPAGQIVTSSPPEVAALGSLERAWVSAVTGEAAAKLGYSVAAVGPIRAAIARGLVRPTLSR